MWQTDKEHELMLESVVSVGPAHVNDESKEQMRAFVVTLGNGSRVTVPIGLGEAAVGFFQIMRNIIARNAARGGTTSNR
jgi:hypothetical protein